MPKAEQTLVPLRLNVSCCSISDSIVLSARAVVNDHDTCAKYGSNTALAYPYKPGHSYIINTKHKKIVFYYSLTKRSPLNWHLCESG